MKNRAFTLIELLVVIAIIAILAAILFPVFAQAKAAAKKTQSLSNVKQTALGVLMYMGDSDDVFPQGSGCGWYYPLDGGWAWDTQPYIKSLPILRDPSDPLTHDFWQSWFDPTVAVGISFASNGFQAWDPGANAWDLFGVMGMDQGNNVASPPTDPRCPSGSRWMGNMVANQSTVNDVAGSIMLATRYSGQNLFGQGDMMSGVNWWDYTGPGLIPDGTRDGTPYQAPKGDFSANVTVNKDNRWGAVAAVYANQGLFALVDGHAKAMNPLATDPDPVNQPNKNMWNVRR